MFQGLTGLHLIIILGIVVLFFGATKLPGLAKGLGQSINIFKKEMASDDRGQTVVTEPTAQSTVAPQAVVNPEPSVKPIPETKA
jgi:sec-independent protein translocase protein TatA